MVFVWREYSERGREKKERCVCLDHQAFLEQSVPPRMPRVYEVANVECLAAQEAP